MATKGKGSFMTHEERYQYLVNHQQGGTVTNYYRSAFYLLSGTEELFENSKKHTVYGIDFPPIKTSFRYEEIHLKTLVEIAESLYCCYEECKITPRLIALMPAPYFQWVVNAMHIAAGNCIPSIVEGKFELDFSPYEENNAQQQQD